MHNFGRHEVPWIIWLCVRLVYRFVCDTGHRILTTLRNIIHSTPEKIKQKSLHNKQYMLKFKVCVYKIRLGQSILFV